MRLCKTCGERFEITSDDLKFYKKFDVEPIDLCFECDQKRRLCFRNERKLYQRKCDGTGAKIISIYSPEKSYKVYKSDYWYGDKWDAISYGRDFDFGRGFFEQFRELQSEVPRLGLFNIRGENSDYCNMTVGNKNCYLFFGGDFNEDAMYGTLSMYNLKCLDLDFSNYNELCYMISDCVKCYSCSFVFDCNNCSDCHFVSDCIGCHELILCTNLVKKSYCINNEQFSKEEYLAKKKDFLNGSFAMQQQNFQNFLKLRGKRIVKYGHIVQCQNSDGDYLKNCKNCHVSFDSSDSEDMKNVIYAIDAKDCFNSTLIGHGTELSYNNLSSISSNDVKFSFFTIDSFNIEYCEMSIGNKYLFGCIGLRQKQYSILNKEYRREEFENLRARIIEHMKKTGEWGEFFPKDLSCFGYNETSAHDYFPLEKEQALKERFKWFDVKEPEPKKQDFEIPDNINDAPRDLCGKTLACEECGKNFKILENELNFYRRLGIPMPRNCSNCRHNLRMSLRNPRKLWDGECEKCGAKFRTTYAPTLRSEQTASLRIYCEKCYIREVF